MARADESIRSNGRPSKSPERKLQPQSHSKPQHEDKIPDPQEPVVDFSYLQPRVALALGIPKRWHPFLIACRLLSTAPTLWWGIRCALRLFIIQVFDLSTPANGGNATARGIIGQQEGAEAISEGISRLAETERSLKLVETGLAIIWASASAYLAFFFTDRLMSRWLVNYTPEATIIRLVTLCAGFAYTTSWVVWLTGGASDPSLLLPSWIGISAALTACYAYSQRKIMIRKETRLSIRVFSIASFISMVALLVHSHVVRIPTIYADPEKSIPLVALVRHAGAITRTLIVKLLDVHAPP